MAHSCDFAVVKISPDSMRDEALNAAVVVFRGDGLDVHVAPTPERLRAIAPGFASETLEELAASLRALDPIEAGTTERIELLRGLPGLFISDPGSLQAETASALEKQIDGLAARLLSPVRGIPRPAPHPKSSALAKELTKVFREEKLLGRGDDAIKRHKVVKNFPISSDGSLRADFAAQNSKMHITETVDLRTHSELTSARLKDVAVAAVTLAEAKRRFGRRTERYFVYAATPADESQAKGYLEAADHNAEHMFNFASRQDRATYLDFIIGALREDLAARARNQP